MKPTGLDHPPFGVAIRYDWGEGAVAVRLEGEMALPIEVEELSGRRLFMIERGDVERWCVCDDNATARVGESLASSSFVVLRRGDARWRVLVREEGMAHRPSILSELSPDEILEYWSLLSAEERAAFIERHAAFGEAIEGIPAVERDPLGAGDTLFDRFAGVFHAFGCLRRNIEKALEDGRHDEAEMRLLGAKYDSLPELLRKTLEREDGRCSARLRHFPHGKTATGRALQARPAILSRPQTAGPEARPADRGRDRTPRHDFPQRRFAESCIPRMVRARLPQGLGASLMRTITPEFLDKLIDFVPSGADRDKAFGRQQREGTVAAFNMLARNGCAYLADEVGTGKTYVALGVMSLLRYFDPHARIVVIAPRENIQRKWVKELRNFVGRNWLVVGNRVKSLQGGPVWEPVVCNSLVEFAREALVNQDRDFLLRMTSFSIRLSDPEDRRKTRRALLGNVPWLERRHVPNRTPEGFRDAFAVALNGAVPEADLVIVDEAHNLT